DDLLRSAVAGPDDLAVLGRVLVHDGRRERRHAVVLDLRVDLTLELLAGLDLRQCRRCDQQRCRDCDETSHLVSPFVRWLPHPTGIYATGRGARMLTAKKNPPQRVFWSLVRRSGGVAAQPSRELFEVADAARLGAVAPVLQLADKLLARRARALPQRDELGAHRVHRVQGARLREPLVEVRALRLAERPLVAVQPALEALQDVGVVRGEAAQLAELLG